MYSLLSKFQLPSSKGGMNTSFLFIIIPSIKGGLNMSAGQKKTISVVVEVKLYYDNFRLGETGSNNLALGRVGKIRLHGFHRSKLFFYRFSAKSVLFSAKF